MRARLRTLIEAVGGDTKGSQRVMECLDIVRSTIRAGTFPRVVCEGTRGQSK